MQNNENPGLDAETLKAFETFFDRYKDNALWHLANYAKEKNPDGSLEQMEKWVRKHQRKNDDFLTQFKKQSKPASRMNAAPSPPKQVWFGLYRGAVSYLAGETGAGKSSALYNIAVHAALDKPLWDIPFELGRPLKVLYLDPENAKLQAASKIGNIGQGRPENLVIHPADGVDLSNNKWQEAFRQSIVEDHYDLVILDPLINLFMTVNENDNPEGAKQINFLQSVAQETKAAILVVHHMGKGIENGSPNYGRGASSRLASADVGLLWRSRKEGDERDDTYLHVEQGVERNDECRLRITKNRLGKESSLYLKMAGGDRFDVSSHQAWNGKAEKGERKPQMEMAVEKITDYLIGGGTKSRAEIQAMLKEEDIGETSGDKALKQMYENKLIQKVTLGKTALAFTWAGQSAQPPVG